MKRLLSIGGRFWDLFVGILIDFGCCPKVFEMLSVDVDETQGDLGVRASTGRYESLTF
jgi:hypothetical protein